MQQHWGDMGPVFLAADVDIASPRALILFARWSYPSYSIVRVNTVFFLSARGYSFVLTCFLQFICGQKRAVLHYKIPQVSLPMCTPNVLIPQLALHTVAALSSEQQRDLVLHL